VKQEEWKVECYKCEEEGHKCREYPLWEKVERKRGKKKAAHVAMPQKVQQKELRRMEGQEAVCVAEP